MKKLLTFAAIDWFVTSSALAEAPDRVSVIGLLRQGPGNVTATPAGKILMSQHQFYEPSASVVEWRGDGSITPFPNEALNDRSWRSRLSLDSVLGIRTDVNGVVWMLDNGM